MESLEPRDGWLARGGGLLVVGRRALEICGVKVGEPRQIEEGRTTGSMHRLKAVCGTSTVTNATSCIGNNINCLVPQVFLHLSTYAES